MVMGAQHLHAMATFWYVVLAVEVWRGIAAVPAQDVAARAVSSSGRWPTLGALMGLAALVEFTAQQFGVDARIVGAAQIIPAADVHGPGPAAGAAVRSRSSRTRKHDRAELERRVQEASAQIERNFAQLAELRGRAGDRAGAQAHRRRPARRPRRQAAHHRAHQRAASASRRWRARRWKRCACRCAASPASRCRWSTRWATGAPKSCLRLQQAGVEARLERAGR